MSFSSSGNQSLFRIIRKIGFHVNVHQSTLTNNLLSRCHVRRIHVSNHMANESFAQKQAVGEIDMNWVFPYPTIESEEKLEELNSFTESVSQHISNNLKTSQFDDEAIQVFKELGLFALRVPSEFGGKAFNNLQFYRLMEELTEPSLHQAFNAHCIPGLHGLLFYGTGDQRHKYFPKLAKGDLIATVALEERNSGSDIAAIECKAHLSDDGRHWILNGEKHWVVNGKTANFFTVFAKTELVDLNDEIVEKTTAFLVEKAFCGIDSDDCVNATGLKGANISTVRFTDTMIPAENVLGKVGDGFKIAVSVLNSDKLSSSNLLASQMKAAISHLYDRSYQKVRFGRRLSEHFLVKQRLFDMSVTAYVIESMLFMTAGNIDRNNDEDNGVDCSIEAAMVKVFSSVAGSKFIDSYQELIGLDSFNGSLPYRDFLDDMKLTCFMKGSNDVLRQYIARGCLQHAAMSLEDRIRASRAGGFRERWTASWDRFRDMRQVGIHKPVFGPKGKPQTKTWLDPRLSSVGQLIDNLTATYAKRVFQNLDTYGKHLEDEQVVLERMSNISMNLYALVCALARCNKSLILGLRSAEHELLLTHAFGQQISRETSRLLEEVSRINVFSYAFSKSKASDELTAERRYLCAHPLEVAHRYVENPKFIEARKRILELAN